MEGFVNTGLFRRKVRFRFDLAALKSATMVCRMDLGEFFTSEKLNDDVRFFYYCYGAWLCGRDHTPKLFRKYQRMFNGLTQKQIGKIKLIKVQCEIISEEYQKALKQAVKAGEKKNR